MFNAFLPGASLVASSPRSPARLQPLVLIYIYNTELSIIFSLQKKRLGTRLVDGTVSEQVKNGLSCSLVICNYGKVQELYETSATRR